MRKDCQIDFSVLEVVRCTVEPLISMINISVTCVFLF